MPEFRVVFDAKDYEASVRFYRDVLELRLSGGWDRGGFDKGSLFAAAGAVIEVMALGRGAGYVAPANARIAYEVEDVDREYERLTALGVASTPPVDFPWGHRGFNLLDPDGIRISIFSAIPARDP